MLVLLGQAWSGWIGKLRMSNIPTALHEIFQGDDSIEIKDASDLHCYLLWGPLEFRFQVCEDNKGNRHWEWDEIVGKCSIHIEMMSENNYALMIDLDDGRSASISIGARRAPVRMTGCTETP